jgi:uncharacterized protein (DUF1697 family)
VIRFESAVEVQVVGQLVAFLRGLNVGGHRVKMDALCQRFEGMGFTDVSSFLASGNVIFTAESDDADDMEGQIEADLTAGLGYAVPAFVRTAAQVREIAGRAPFAADLLETSDGKLQVALLRSAPDASARDRVLHLATAADRLALAGRELYWLPSGPMSQSDLDLAVIGQTLPQMTIRTARTIERIAAKIS